MIVVELPERRFISVGCSGGIHGGVAWRWGMAALRVAACVSLVAFMAPGAFAQALNGSSGPAGNGASGPVPGPAPAGSIVVERASLQFHRPNSADAKGDGSWSKLKLSDDEQSLVGCGMELAVWNTKTGKVVRSTAISKAMDGVTLSPDNKTVVAWPHFLDFRPANGLTPIEWWQAGDSRAMGIQIPAGKSQVIADMAFTRDGIEKLGMTDILPVKNCPDLPRDDPRFRELTTVQVEGVCRSGLSGGTVAVVNRSSFPLTNVRAQLSHPTRAGRKTTEEFVAQLPPGEEIEVPYDSQFGRDLLPGNRNKEDRGTIVVVSSQGRATATVK